MESMRGEIVKRWRTDGHPLNKAAETLRRLLREKHRVKRIVTTTKLSPEKMEEVTYRQGLVREGPDFERILEVQLRVPLEGNTHLTPQAIAGCIKMLENDSDLLPKNVAATPSKSHTGPKPHQVDTVYIRTGK